MQRSTSLSLFEENDEIAIHDLSQYLDVPIEAADIKQEKDNSRRNSYTAKYTHLFRRSLSPEEQEKRSKSAKLFFSSFGENKHAEKSPPKDAIFSKLLSVNRKQLSQNTQRPKTALGVRQSAEKQTNKRPSSAPLESLHLARPESVATNASNDKHST